MPAFWGHTTPAQTSSSNYAFPTAPTTTAEGEGVGEAEDEVTATINKTNNLNAKFTVELRRISRL
jgi:hypothetical protein